MRTVTIPGGEATFRESDDLRAKDSDLIEAAAMAASSALSKLPDEALRQRQPGETDEQVSERVERASTTVRFTLEEAQAMIKLRRATLMATLVSWTLRDEHNRPRPVPTSIDELEELPRDLVRALDEAIGGIAVKAGTDYSVSSDPESPTQPSND